MRRSLMMALSTVLATTAFAANGSAQVVYVDVGVGTPDFGARVVWGTAAPVVVYEPVPAYRPVVYRVVYYESWPVSYWDHVRVHDPYRYARFRAWRDYERDYRRAWHANDHARLEQLRAREARYFRERRDAERGFRAWRAARDHDDDRDRGRSRGRGRR